MTKPKLRITLHDLHGVGNGITAARFEAKIEVLDADGMTVADANVVFSGKLQHGVYVNYVELNDAQSGVSDLDPKET